MNDESKVKSGDVVELKSGGPKMTVGLVNGEGLAGECHWADQNGNVMTAKFCLAALKTVDPTN